MYLQLLGDPYFQVSALESILSWLQDETARVEDELLRQADSIDTLTKCFVNSKANSFENVLDPLLKMIRLSTPITLAISKSPAFFRRIVDRLQVGQGGKTKAVVRLNLLRILRAVCDVHPNKAVLVEKYGLLGVVERLSRDGGEGGAVLVRELARELVPALKPALRPSSSGGLNGSLASKPRGKGTNSMDLTPPTSLSSGSLSSTSLSSDRDCSQQHHRERKALAPKRLRRAASEASPSTVSGVGQNEGLLLRPNHIRDSGNKGLLSGRPVLSTKPCGTSSSRQRLGDISWQNSSNGNENPNDSGGWK